MFRGSVVAYDSPQHMIEGNWTQAIILDRAATRAQRDAVESILTGRAGGPWSVLARFVSQRLETRVKLLEEELRGGINLNRFYVEPDDSNKEPGQ